MTDKPTVNDGAQAPSESGKDGPANLDALLSEFDSQAGKPETKQGDPTKGLLATLKPVIQFAETEMANRVQAETQTTIKSAIDFVKKDAAEIEGVPDKVIRGLLGTYADEDGDFRSAFVGRHQNPGTWQSKLTEVRSKILADLKPMSESRVTSDIVAARASISGASSTKADAPKVTPDKAFAMTGREWDAFIREQMVRT